MPTETWTPQADTGFYTGWSSVVGTDFAHEAVDAVDSNYIVLPRLVGSAGIASFPIALMAEGQIPTSITVRCTALKEGAAARNLQIGLGLSNEIEVDPVDFTLAETDTTTTRVFSTNPFTAAAWADGDLIGLTVLVTRKTAEAGLVRLNRLEADVTFHTRKNWSGNPYYIGRRGEMTT